jgi:hypothetical protein
VAMGKAPERRAVSVAPPGRATATRDKRQARPKSETGRLSVLTGQKGGHFFSNAKSPRRSRGFTNDAAVYGVAMKRNADTVEPSTKKKRKRHPRWVESTTGLQGMNRRRQATRRNVSDDAKRFSPERSYLERVARGEDEVEPHEAFYDPYASDASPPPPGMWEDTLTSSSQGLPQVSPTLVGRDRLQVERSLEQRQPGVARLPRTRLFVEGPNGELFPVHQRKCTLVTVMRTDDIDIEGRPRRTRVLQCDFETHPEKWKWPGFEHAPRWVQLLADPKTWGDAGSFGSRRYEFTLDVRDRTLIEPDAS